MSFLGLRCCKFLADSRTRYLGRRDEKSRLTATSAQWKRSPLSVNWTGGEHYGVREDRFWRPANFRMARNRSQRQTPRSRLELNLARQMLRVAAPVANYERCGAGFCPVRNRAKRHECRHGRLELALRFAIVELWM
jgi:hypothetical protein